MDATRKNTSVFLEGVFSRKERKAGRPTSVSATIDRSGHAVESVSSEASCRKGAIWFIRTASSLLAITISAILQQIQLL